MENDQEINQESKVYELGFHLVPTIAEDAVSSEFEKIKDLIKKEGGEFISEGAPELKTLAYTISKTVKATKTKHSRAYFGWVKFILSPEAVLKIKKALDASEVILRYLIVITVKESTLWIDKDSKRIPRPEAKEEGKSEEGAEAPEELDKTIDALVIN